MDKKHYYIYIATNQRNTVLYTGVTNNLSRRETQHKEQQDKNSFTAKYNVNKLVYLEEYNDINNAIAREKQIKNLLRKKKIDLIEKINPNFEDLSDKLG